MKAVSPGKLILSGEHAVVYGQPAIAMAVDRFAVTTIQPQLSKLVSFNLLNLRYKDSFTIQTLREVKHRLLDQYKLFLHGESSIREVLSTPFELALFTFINVFDHFNSKIIDGLNIKTHSTIPIGCGMGSSAAVVLSVLHAIATYFNIPFDQEKYLYLGNEAEKLQHGFPSGLDAYVSLQGGGVYFHKKEKTSFVLPEIPMFMVNTGTPVTTTGQCVESVAKGFAHDVIWDDFGAVTQSICEAFTNRKLSDIQQGIRENHRLLVHIGVVPSTVQAFIRDIEDVGAAAKICGAGAVMGEQCGIVLIVTESDELVAPICARYGYRISPIKKESRGLHLV